MLIVIFSFLIFFLMGSIRAFKVKKTFFIAFEFMFYNLRFQACAFVNTFFKTRVEVADLLLLSAWLHSISQQTLVLL